MLSPFSDKDDTVFLSGDGLVTHYAPPLSQSCPFFLYFVA